MQLPVAVAAALEAADAGNTEDFLAAFGGGGVVVDGGREFRGREAIRGWSDAEFIGRGVTLRVTGVRGQGETVTVGVEVRGEGVNAVSDFAFTAQGGYVELLRITG